MEWIAQAVEKFDAYRNMVHTRRLYALSAVQVQHGRHRHSLRVDCNCGKHAKASLIARLRFGIELNSCI